MDSSDNDASRSIMLRRQREAALRRRSYQMPPKSDENCEDGCRSAAPMRRIGSASTIAVEDVMAWEEAKKKERIEARIKEEGIRRAKEAKMRAEALVVEEEERIRRLEFEKYEKHKLDIRRKLEADEMEKAERKLDEEKAEKRRLAEAIAEAERLEREMLERERLAREKLERERLEKERMDRERMENDRLEKERLERDKMTNLERRLAEAEKARMEAERLAERACRMEQLLSMESRSSAPSAPPQTSGSIDLKCNPVSGRATNPDSKNEYPNGNGTRMVHLANFAISDGKTRQATVSDHEVQGRSTQDMTGSNSGYQRYLAAFHQPSSVGYDGISGGESGTHAPSESSEGYSPSDCTPMFQPGPNRPTTAPMTKSPEKKCQKIKRSVSTRSLMFADTVATEEMKTSESFSNDAPRQEGSKLPLEKIQSLQHITSIDSVNLGDPIFMRYFLMKPCPRGLGMIQCYVRRNKGIKNALFPEYRMHLKGSDGKSQTFLMTSKKRGTMSLFTPLLKFHRQNYQLFFH
ncbi:hypothetical protein ACHAXA_005919 [Cyclostephanos tholiformis]|uniref:Tubby C-terminal domain-containing protein n=1 Tax=Cyclostephanos tholiformis TaxID=382380 RepID=A0ABD3SCX5_9STRA